MKWINCTERQPEKAGWYLVELKTNGIMDVRYFMEEGVWFCLSAFHTEIGCWMKLPASNYGNDRLPAQGKYDKDAANPFSQYVQR